LKIAFFGNPQFAVPTFQALIASTHQICCVITGPDRKAGRSQKIQFSAVKQIALEQNLPILQPEDLNSTNFLSELDGFKPEIGVVVAYRILPREVFTIPPMGCVNLHPSMLPDLRGAAPINWALIRGYQKSGISTFLIKERVDAGSILIQEEVDIFPEDDAGSLSERLSIRCGKLIIESLDRLEAGNLVPSPQTGKPTRAPKLTDETRQISWDKPAEEIHNLVRGLSPIPCSYTFLGSKRLKIYGSSVDSSTSIKVPGTVIGYNDNSLQISTANGTLCITELQLEGKRKMTAEEFNRGNPIPAGTLLGKI